MVELMPTKKTPSNRGSRDASAWAQLSASSIGGWGTVAVMWAIYAVARRGLAGFGHRIQALGLSGSGRRAVKRSPMELPPMRVNRGLFKEVNVLGSTNAAATIAVKDIAVARKFYENTLGLELSGTEGESVRSYRSGSSTILVYESRFAGTNQATAATWIVGDALDATVRPHRQGGGLRALRPPWNDAAGRRARLGENPGRLVQGPRRQHPVDRQWIGRLHMPDLTITRVLTPRAIWSSRPGPTLPMATTGPRRAASRSRTSRPTCARRRLAAPHADAGRQGAPGGRRVSRDRRA